MIVIVLLALLPVLTALAIIVLGLWLAIRRSTPVRVAVALVAGPVLAFLWTFGGYKGLDVPLLQGELTGMPPWLHLAGIVLSFLAVQAALLMLVRRGPHRLLAIPLCIAACLSLGGPLFVHSHLRADVAAAHAAPVLP